MDILVHLPGIVRDCAEVTMESRHQPREDERFVMIASGSLHVYSIDSVIARNT